MSEASRARILYQLARADFLERVRRYSFLVTLGFALYLGYLAATGQILLNLGKYQAVYNAAYVGGFMSYITTLFLTLAGFYIVKNAIERDRKTGVGQILAACSMRKLDYCLGKLFSNFAVLCTMVAVLAFAGVGMYFLHGDKSGFHPATFLAPFAFLALPAMAFTAGIALFFEVLPGLRGGLGNIAYFFVWNGILLLGALTIFTNTPLPFLDLTGGFSLWSSMSASLASTFPGAEANGFALSMTSFPNEIIGIFRWNGFAWTAVILLSRLFWASLALGLAFVSSAFFDRFDSSNGRAMQPVLETLAAPTDVPTNAATPAQSDFVPIKLTGVSTRFRFGAAFVAELRLMLKGQHWWWYLVAAGLAIASGAVVPANARGMVLAFAWIWPVLIWSQMGVRESRDQTSQILFSMPHPLVRQLPAIWLAGVAVAALTGSGFALRMLIAANERGFLAWLIGALFIPTLALALGVWSGTGKLFEILYTLLWYLGPFHSITQLDFMGAAPATAETRYPAFYFALTGVLAIVALAGRKRQLQT